jgi:hypothetical protein
VGCALGYFDIRYPDHPWRKHYPRLGSWYCQFETRPSMQVTRYDTLKATLPASMIKEGPAHHPVIRSRLVSLEELGAQNGAPQFDGPISAGRVEASPVTSSCEGALEMGAFPALCSLDPIGFDWDVHAIHLCGGRETHLA